MAGTRGAGGKACWTEVLNQEFLQCIAAGHITDKKPIWTSSIVDVAKKDWSTRKEDLMAQKSSDGWKRLATSAEMCFIFAKGVHKDWAEIHK